MKFPTIYKRTSAGKIQEWTAEVEGNKFRTISGQTDGKKTTSEYTVCFPKNVGKTNETTGEEQAIAEAKALMKKKLESGYMETIDSVDNHSKHVKAVMLAKSFDDYKDDIEFPVFIQPKLDGMRNKVSIDGMYSRNGKPTISAPHILNFLQPVLEKFPGFVFDGELYAHKYRDDFNTLISLAKKTKPTDEELLQSAQHLEYHIYDVITEGTYAERFKILEEVFYHINDVLKIPHDNKLVLVHTCTAHTHEEIDQYYNSFLNEGYEGAIVRINAPYEAKRTKSLLKLKPDFDAEYEIVEVEEGEGNRTGMAGNIIVKLPDGRTFSSNIIGNQEYCRKLLADRESLRGKLATIRYQNLTPKKEDGTGGVPRFPYMKAIRDYE